MYSERTSERSRSADICMARLQEQRRECHEGLDRNDCQRIFGPPESRDSVMARIQANEEVYADFCRLTPKLQEEFVSFCMGTRGVNITYDRVFKLIFDPELYPDRLEDFLRHCLNRNLKILQVLPNESKRLTQEGSLLVLDIIVQMETGEVVNVEIQRIGYLFPGQRCACYSSDLVMRQYSKVRAERNNDGKPFSYQDIKTVYTIVLIQQSTKEFKKLPDQYLHHGKQIFDSGLELNMVQEYLLINLDNFMEIHHNISSKLDAWLYLIASDDPEDILGVITAYPEFEEIYRQVFQFRYQMKELMGMFSEALSILDRNTVQYMIEQQKEELLAQTKKLLAQKEELEAQTEELEAQTKELQQKDNQLLSQAAEIARLKALLNQTD